MTDNSPNNLPVLPQYVTSERLIIRPSTRADGLYLQKWWNDPFVMKTDGNPDAMQYDEQDIEEWFQRCVDGREYATHFVICLREPAEKPIGEFYIACDDRPACIDVAILIGESDLWDQGYGSEMLTAYAEAAFRSECCSAVRMNIAIAHARALRMCQRVGFEIEHVWANGQFQTMILTEAAFKLVHTPATAGRSERTL